MELDRGEGKRAENKVCKKADIKTETTHFQAHPQPQSTVLEEKVQQLLFDSWRSKAKHNFYFLKSLDKI